jgi:hypothetical protein
LLPKQLRCQAFIRVRESRGSGRILRSLVRIIPGPSFDAWRASTAEHEARLAGHRFLREEGIDRPDNEGQSQQRCSERQGVDEPKRSNRESRYSVDASLIYSVASTTRRLISVMARDCDIALLANPPPCLDALRSTPFWRSSPHRCSRQY